MAAESLATEAEIIVTSYRFDDDIFVKTNNWTIAIAKCYIRSYNKKCRKIPMNSDRLTRISKHTNRGIQKRQQLKRV